MAVTVPKRREIILIPCEKLVAVAILAPSTIPTRLEELVLSAIHNGGRTIEILTPLFHIGQRPMLRLVLDLLNRSLVTFNFSTGDIRLTPRVAKLIESGHIADIPPGEKTEKRVVVMRDLIAGTVLPMRRRPQTKSAIRLTSVLEPHSKSTVGADSIFRAIRSQLRDSTTRSGRPLHILDVSFATPEQASEDGAMWELEVEATYCVDENIGDLRIEIEQPEDLPWRTRFDLNRALTTLANDQNPPFAFRNLRATASVTSDRTIVRGIGPHLEHLQSIISGLDAIDGESLPERQNVLERAVIPVKAALEIFGEPLETEILGDETAHVSAISEIIRSANQQLVLACPSVGYDAVQQFRADLEYAVAKGTRVFLLFGKGDSINVDIGVFNWLSKLKERHPTTLFFSSKSAKFNTPLVVSDWECVVFAGYDYLGKSARVGADCFGLRTQSPRSSRPHDEIYIWQPAVDILVVVRGVFPEYADGQMIVTLPWSFRSQGARDTSDDCPRLPDTRSDEFDQFRYKLWRREWQRHCADLQARSDAVGTSYQIVKNSELLQIIFDGLRSAKRRLIVSCEQMSTRMIDRRFLEDLRGCLDRGVRVLLVCNRQEASLRGALSKLSETYPDRLEVLCNNASDGLGSSARGIPALICDNWAAVSSFEFLSSMARYDGAERHRARTEIGIWLQGEPVVDRIAAAIGKRDVSVDTPSTTHDSAMRTVPAQHVPEPIRSLVPLLNAIAEGHSELTNNVSTSDILRQSGKLLTTWFNGARGVSTAFEELSELEAVQVPFLSQAVAACIYLYPDGSMAKDWIEILAKRLWWRREREPHVVAILVGTHQPTSHEVPPFVLAALDASAGNMAMVHRFEEASLECSESQLALALAALAMQRVLLDSCPPSEALRLLSEQLGEAPLRWATSVLACREVAPLGLREFLASGEFRPEELIKRAAESRERLVEELRRCIGLRLDFKLGQRTWASFVGRPSGFNALLDGAVRGDVDRVRQCTVRLFDAKVDVVLDRAVGDAAVGMVLSERPAIKGPRRRLCIDRLSRVLGCSHEWSEAAEIAKIQTIGAPPPELVNAVRDVASHYSDVCSLRDHLRSGREYGYPIVADLAILLERMVAALS